MNEYYYAKSVEPLEDYKLLITFSNGEKKVYDMKSQLDDWYYEPLKNIEFFKTVHIARHTVVWNGEIDICPEDLYESSKLVVNS
ncbi:MAG: DUF2442 domain-containing protein [Candidatus Paraimprobicoccus trichonymphae]|uniref:DUF2442 domain-containing protein n=1 Tax=Candidatus Paraimprobicoccus trichonymphae TaxID=3033793 RepID=A0AA48HZR8_9FIRM|nr:MAG: DUF2442 domain-containing protein [Candidatus Paraimprobicoccus trichonymphae]